MWYDVILALCACKGIGVMIRAGVLGVSVLGCWCFGGQRGLRSEFCLLGMGLQASAKQGPAEQQLPAEQPAEQQQPAQQEQPPVQVTPLASKAATPPNALCRGVVRREGVLR